MGQFLAKSINLSSIERGTANYKKFWLGCALCLLYSYGIAFDLLDAYTSAMSYNANYLANIAKNKALEENQIQGRAQLLPQLNASAAMSENYLYSEGAELFYHQPSYGLSLQQVVFDFAKFSQYSKSKYSTQIANLQLELAKEQLIIDVAKGYFDVLYAIDNLAAITASKNAFAKQLSQAKHSFDAGLVTAADVNDAQSGYDQAVADEIKATNDLIDKKNLLQNITGLNPDLVQPIITNIKLTTPNPSDPKSWTSLANIHNLNIQIAKTQVLMANDDVKIAVAGHLPSIYLTGQYQNQGALGVDGSNSLAQQTIINPSSGVPGSILSSFNIGSADLSVNLPLYAGGAISSQVRQAKNNYIAAAEQLIAVTRDTDQKAENAFWQVKNGLLVVKAQTDALKSAAVKLKSDQLGYKVGVRNSVDLVNSEKNYYQAVQSYNQARYQYLLAILQLQFFSGMIDSKILAGVNQNIEPIVMESANHE